jgi:hypothetical protein
MEVLLFIFLFLLVLFKNNRKNNFALIAQIAILLQNFTLPLFINISYFEEFVFKI